MGKRLISISLGLLIAAASFLAPFCMLAQAPAMVAVTGHFTGLGGVVPTNTYIEFQLTNCGANQPKIFGYTGILPQVADYIPNSTGLVTGTIYPNDVINCGGTTGATRYQVTYMLANVPQGASQCFDIVSGAAFNLDVATPAATCYPTSPVLPNDATFRNLTVTGLFMYNGGQAVQTLPPTSQTIVQPSGTQLTVNGVFDASVLNSLVQTSITSGSKTRAIQYADSTGAIRKVDVYNDTTLTNYCDGTVPGSIEWAINQVGTGGGGLVTVYPGIYPCSTSLVIDWDWVTVAGANKTHWNKWGGGYPTHSSPGLPGGAQIVTTAAMAATVGTTVAHMHGDTRHKGIAIRDMYFNGSNVSQYGVYDQALTDISEISHTTFQGFETYAIDVAWDAHQITYNNIQDNDGGGIEDSGLYPVIQGNIIYDMGGTGIAITGGRQAVISSNDIGVTPNCIVLTGGGSTVFGNTMNNGCNGVVNSGGTNLIYGNFGDAMPFFDSTSGAMAVRGPATYGQIQAINPTAGQEASMFFNDNLLNTGGWAIGKNLGGLDVGKFVLAWSSTSVYPESSHIFQFGQDGSLAMAGGLRGPAAAPTGSCTVAGQWVFSQDGHASACISGSWVVKI